MPVVAVRNVPAQRAGLVHSSEFVVAGRSLVCCWGRGLVCRVRDPGAQWGEACDGDAIRI